MKHYMHGYHLFHFFSWLMFQIMSLPHVLFLKALMASTSSNNYVASS